MRIRFGYLILGIGLVAIVAGVIILGLMYVARPNIFSSDNDIFKIIFPYIKIIPVIGVFLSVLGGVMSDIIGINIISIFRNAIQKKDVARVSNNYYFPFHIISEPDQVLPMLLTGPGLIPDYKIPYQRRLSNKNITEELHNTLLNHKKIFVNGAAGIGKTREIGKLLSAFIDEGFTVVLAKSNARFDVPINFPERPRHRLIFVFDDIHQNCAIPSGDSLAETITTGDYLENLRVFINKVQNRYTSLDVYIILIARRDIESWDKLMYPTHKIWEGFEQYQMPYPDLESQQKLILDISERLELVMSETEALELAKANDGTFRNLIQNLYRSKRDNYQLLVERFSPKQGLTWSDRYKVLCEKYKIAPSIFESLIILKEMNIPSYSNLVISLSRILYVGLLFHRFQLIADFIARKKPSETIKQLELEGDLFIKGPEKEIVSHELLLKAHPHQVDSYRLLPSLWLYLQKINDPDSWYEFAKYSINKAKRITLGVKILTYCLRHEQSNAKVRLLRCKGLMQLGYLKYALVDAETACKLNPDYSEAYMYRGIIHMLSGEKEMAKFDYEKAISIDKNDYTIFLNRASLLVSQNDYVSAEKDLNRAIQLEPEDLNLYQYRSEVRWKAGKHQGALVDLDYVLKRDIKNVDALLMKASYFLEDKEKKLAEGEIHKALLIDENNSEIYFLKSTIAYQNDNLQLAEDLLTQAIRLSPYKSRYYFARGEIRLKLHKYLQGKEDINRSNISELDKTNYANYKVLKESETRRLSEKEIEDLLQEQSLTENSYLALARAYSKTRNFEMALSILEKCIKKYPDSDSAYHERAHIYISQKKTNLALQDFDTAFQLDHTNLMHLRCSTKYLTSLNRNKDALNELTTALKSYPENIDLHINYISALSALKQLNSKVKFKYIGQLQRNPKSLLILISLSYISYLNKDYKQAKEYYNLSLDITHDDVEIAYHQLRLIRFLSLKSLLFVFKSIRKFQTRVSETLFYEAMYRYSTHDVEGSILPNLMANFMVIASPTGHSFGNMISRLKIKVLRTLDNDSGRITKRELDLK